METTYNLIALAIRHQINPEPRTLAQISENKGRCDMARAIARALDVDAAHPTFDSDVFLDACGVVA